VAVRYSLVAKLNEHFIHGPSMIAVFGDSWAEPTYGHRQYPEMDQLAWPNLLGEPVVNLAAHGSSLYYTYRQFLDHHHLGDRVIVVVTSYGRLPVNDIVNREGRVRYVSTAQNAIDLIKNHRSEWDDLAYQRLLAMREYYLWLENYSADTRFAYLMLAEIRRLRPDAIIIPAFKQKLSPSSPLLTSLNDWVRPTIRGIDPVWLANNGTLPYKNGTIPYKEIRCICHLPPEANASIALAVKAALARGSWGIEPVPDTIPHEHGLAHYWDMARRFKD